MSVYTTELRFICESLAGKVESVGQQKVYDVLDKAADKIFDFSYPYYDTLHKKDWEIKFLRHFYTREISAETYGLWKLWLQDRIVTLMPKYNPMYRAVAQDIGIYVTDSYVETGNTETNSTGSSQGSNSASDSGSSKSSLRRSDTPQGTVEDLESNRYMSEAELEGSTDSRTSSGENSQSSKAVSTGSDTRKRTGFSGRTAADMMREYRNKMDSIDLLFYQDCEDLFIQYYGGIY